MKRDAKMNSCKCEICNAHILRATYAKRLRSKKHIEIEKQNEMIKPEMSFQEVIESKI